MRSASSYRGAKKKAAREAGVPFSKFNEHFAKSRMYAAHELERKAINATPAAAQEALDVLGGALTPADARKALGIWARNGGRATALSPAITQAELDAMNKPPELTDEQIADAAKKLTAEDIDKALEATLSKWQADRHREPLPLSKLFAARARQLGWVEDVEFAEEK
jgi:hypothetical protein